MTIHIPHQTFDSKVLNKMHTGFERISRVDFLWARKHIGFHVAYIILCTKNMNAGLLYNLTLPVKSKNTIIMSYRSNNILVILFCPLRVLLSCPTFSTWTLDYWCIRLSIECDCTYPCFLSPYSKSIRSLLSNPNQWRVRLGASPLSVSPSPQFVLGNQWNQRF